MLLLLQQMEMLVIALQLYHQVQRVNLYVIPGTKLQDKLNAAILVTLSLRLKVFKRAELAQLLSFNLNVMQKLLKWQL